MQKPSITGRIRTARRLCDQYGGRLREYPALSRELVDLRSKIEASRRAAVACGVAEACSRCDRKEGGSCCGAGIEDRYRPVLLVLNLLLGAELPDGRALANGCFFLGAEGCVLEARELLCINYLCLGLQKALPRERLLELQCTTGEEMDAIFRIHEMLSKLLRDLGG
jgi:hypothetical protein